MLHLKRETEVSVLLRRMAAVRLSPRPEKTYGKCATEIKLTCSTSTNSEEQQPTIALHFHARQLFRQVRQVGVGLVHADEQRVAVGRRACHRLGGKRATRSTTAVLPPSPSFCAKVRPTRSAMPPAGVATMILIGWVGNSCAAASPIRLARPHRMATAIDRNDNARMMRPALRPCWWCRDFADAPSGPRVGPGISSAGFAIPAAPCRARPCS